jgi:hypothetical protein
MPKTIETIVYKFNELSNKAKETAISKNYDINIYYDWWNMTYEDANLIGFNITSFSIDRNYHLNAEFNSSAIDTAKLIVDMHGENCATYQLSLQFKTDCLVLEVKYLLLGNEDSYEAQSEYDDLQDTYLENLQDAYLKILKDEYEYLTSDTAIAERLEVNDYYLTVDGERC